MNIWLLNEYYYPSIGGIETSLFCLSKEFSEMGHDVTIIYKDNGKTGRDREYAKLCPYPNKYRIINKLARPIMPFITYRIVRNYMRELAREEYPDLIVGRDAIMSVASLDLKRAKLVYIPPTILKFNKGSASDNKGFVNKLFYYRELLFLHATWKYQRQALRNIEHLIVFSENMKEQVEETGERKGKSITVSCPGLNDKFELENTLYEYDTEKMRGLFVGRIVDDKNLFMLVDALTLLKQKEIPIVMSIVGDGNVKQQLIEYVKQKGLQDIVSFFPNTRVPEEYMRTHDFFILPSKYEALGQVVLESQACGTPVIGFKKIDGITRTAIGELVEDGVTGYVVKKFNARALSEAIEKGYSIYREKEKYLKMRLETRSKAVKDYSWKRFAEGVLEDIGR
ncbi:glycosyltransferase family 4 protein [Butyrivibrio sp. FCS014]|uniref:glycosyltransferase family 4 protein n=1 Tax=Butyrivibrio sp. FCS014 TaxID=1408304 RepID=UPI000464B69B|nr:glycosyltransferase family 4 protein [Butyrivibrio sp. FCS014]